MTIKPLPNGVLRLLLAVTVVVGIWLFGALIVETFTRLASTPARIECPDPAPTPIPSRLVRVTDISMLNYLCPDESTYVVLWAECASDPAP